MCWKVHIVNPISNTIFSNLLLFLPPKYTCFSRPFFFHAPLNRAVGHASHVSVKLFYQNIGVFISLRCIFLSCTSQKVLVTYCVPFEAALPASVCRSCQHKIHADIWKGTWFKPRRNNSYCARCAVIRRLEDAFKTSFYIRHSLSRYLTLHNWQFKMMSSDKYELTKAVRRNIIRHHKLTKQTIIVLTHQKIARHY